MSRGFDLWFLLASAVGEGAFLVFATKFDKSRSLKELPEFPNNAHINSK